MGITAAAADPDIFTIDWENVLFGMDCCVLVRS